jgi:CBS domain-containing protein
MSEAARQMYMAGTDAVVVVDEGHRKAVGLVTARDVVAVVAEGLDPERITIGQRLQSPRTGDPRSTTQNDLWFS